MRYTLEQLEALRSYVTTDIAFLNTVIDSSGALYTYDETAATAPEECYTEIDGQPSADLRKKLMALRDEQELKLKRITDAIAEAKSKIAEVTVELPLLRGHNQNDDDICRR